MWLSKQLTGFKEGSAAVYRGEITGYRPECLTIQSGEEHRDTRLLGPYGVTALPAQGVTAAVLPLEGGTACAGVVQTIPDGLLPGEIQLRSAGGARIVLKNDGSILLNDWVVPALEGGNA